MEEAAGVGEIWVEGDGGVGNILRCVVQASEITTME